MVEVESHERVSGFEHCQQDCGIGLSTGVWLHVGIFCMEEFLGTVNGDLFGLVHDFAAAIVSFAGIAFSVFVGQAGSHGLHHFGADEVFGCDEFDSAELAAVFFLNEIEDLCVSLHG